MTMSRRAYYYCAGDNSAAATAVGMFSKQAMGTATGWAQNAYAAVAMNKSAPVEAAAAAVTSEAVAQLVGEA